MNLTAVPASPDQQRALAALSDKPLDSAAVEQLALKGFVVSDIWGSYTPPVYIVKPIISPGQKALIFGESGHFKSVIAIDLALCVASGRPFHGVKVKRAGVVYVAGEGHGGIRKRVRAWLLHHGYDATSEQPSVYVTEAGADLMGNPLQLKATVEQAKRTLGCDIGLVVIDTLAANFGAGDENHASDMQTAVNNALDAAQGGAVLFVHHTGHGSKEQSARERGSYSLRATLDCRMHAIYDDASKLIELRFLRVKDGEEPAPMAFSWRKVPIGWADEDGEELTSVVLEKSAETPQEGVGRTGTAGMGMNQEIVLKVIKRLYRVVQSNLEEQGREPGEGRILLSGVRSDCVPRHMPLNRFSEAVKALEKRGLVRVDSPHIFLTEMVDSW